MARNSRISNLIFVIVLFLVLMTIYNLLSAKPVWEIPYSQLLTDAEAGKLEEVVVKRDQGILQGTYKPNESSEPSNPKVPQGTPIKVHLPPDYEGTLKSLQESGVKITLQRSSEWASLISPSTLFIILIFVFPILFIYMLLSRQMQGGGGAARTTWIPLPAAFSTPASTRAGTA